MTCEQCSSYRFCLERRGICADFKPVDLKKARKEIESINQKHKSSIPGRADKGGVQKAGSRRCVKVPKS